MTDPKSRFVQPVAITSGGTLISSSASTAGDPAAWSGATTYAAGDQRQYNNIIYQSLQAGNLNHQPDAAGSLGVWWAKVSPINQLAMFDSSVSTQTTNADSIVVVLKPGQSIDTLAVKNIAGATVDVAQNDPVDGLVYSESQRLTFPVYDWWNAMWTSPRRKTSALFTGFKPYPQATITVTITRTGGIAKCGLLVVGNSMQTNAALYGATDGITDYSIVQTDSFGVRDIVPRDYADDSDFQVKVNTADSQVFRDLLASVRATPILVLPADTSRPDLQYYGLVSFRRTMSFPTFDLYAISTKGYT